jgi:hypothetical protein
MSYAFTFFSPPPRPVPATSPVKPRCPNCGKDELTLVGSQEMYSPAGACGPKPPTVRITVHRCRCGIAFTETQTPAKSVNSAAYVASATASGKLAEEVGCLSAG